MTTEHTSLNLKFFRQAGWMAMATTIGGVLMYGVHAVVRLKPAEYSVFVVLLQVLNLMLIPAIGVQAIMAQQAAAAITEAGRRQLATTVRVLLLGVGAIWVGMALPAWWFQGQLLAALQISNPSALWITILAGLAILWLPILQGVLQGQQNFLWLGWLQIANGAGRILGVIFFVWVLGGGAAGAMTGAFAGYLVAVLAAGWLCRAVWGGAGDPVAWRAWLARVIPLTLGLAACQFMMAADAILVQTTFSKEVAGLYGAAGTIGRGLIFFTGAVFAVMFPKVVASKAHGRRSNVLVAALGATGVLGGVAALGCTLLPALPLRIIYSTQPEYWQMASLVPWFAWCMLPLSLANVLVGHLLAHERYRAVPWLMLVAIGYGVALWAQQDILRQLDQVQAFRRVVLTLGSSSLLLLVVATCFTRGDGHPQTPQP